MTKSYPEMTAELTGLMKEMHKSIPSTMRGFAACADGAKEGGALDHKTKELMAVALAVATRCDGCIGFHVRGAVKAGATRQELMETLGVAIMMGGGPSTIYGAYAVQAYDQFAAA